MKDKRKIGIIVTIVVMLLTVFGITYAFINYTLLGNRNSVLVTGDIYMNYTESNQINLENAIPMSKDEALKLEKNTFNFTITGKNQSKKDIYYGISIVYGDPENSKTRLKDEDIDVYLTSGEDVLINANRYKTLDDTRIWVEKISANTESYTKDYSLRMWVDDSVTISDTGGDYTQDIWNNSYASYKVKVDGNLNEMNVPLEVDYQNTYYENGKTYFMVSISNYLNPSEAGISLVSADTMKLDITTTNKDVVFTYQDDAGNKSEDGKTLDSISKTYTFDTNKKVEMQVFVNSKNDIDLKADINIKLSKNEDENYEILKYMHIKGAKDYCKNNGFSNFADCLLVSEQLSNTVEEAKEGITKKGTPDTTKTAPTYTYIETIETPGATVPYTDGQFWYYADSYTFDTRIGTYTLKENVKQSSQLSTDMQGKWTCGCPLYAASKSCQTIYHITSIEENTIKTASSKTYEITNSLGSEIGLYKTNDNDGDTYYYRGDVKNNNVKFAGFYWKIIRINGDGSIRLIYNGDHANATGNETSIINNTVAYNTYARDQAYVGYMYGDFSETPIKSNEATFTELQENQILVLATSFSNDNSAKKFTLTGNTYSSTVKSLGSKLNEGYKYFCRDNLCKIIIEIKSINSPTSLQIYYHAYSPVSYEKTRENTMSSSMKIVLENWYTDTFSNKNENGLNATNYVNTGGTFCNDRSLSSGNGFSLDSKTVYNSRVRIAQDKKPTLVCKDVEQDLFSSKGSSGKGNKKLEKPIGLITADEVSFAGGLINEQNNNYYLRTGQLYYTMTPERFETSSPAAMIYQVTASGTYAQFFAGYPAGVRAVINLKEDVLLAGGNGTMEDPYTVKIAS